MEYLDVRMPFGSDFEDFRAPRVFFGGLFDLNFFAALVSEDGFLFLELFMFGSLLIFYTTVGNVEMRYVVVPTTAMPDCLFLMNERGPMLNSEMEFFLRGYMWYGGFFNDHMPLKNSQSWPMNIAAANNCWGCASC